jgi:hypothetical protein
LLFHGGADSAHEEKCTNRVLKSCDAWCEAEEAGDAVLADAFEALDLRSLEELDEDWLVD